MVACFRRLIGDDAASAVAEYHTYADPKARPLDKDYIRNYDSGALAWVTAHERWVESPEQPRRRSINPITQRRLAPKLKA